MKPLISELFPVTLYFCDDEADYDKVIKKIDGDKFDGDKDEFNHFPAVGEAHTLAFHGDHGLDMVVALGKQESLFTAIDMLIHESVHVFQFVKKEVGEKHPGAEIEAYAVQYYARWMIAQYRKREEKRISIRNDKAFKVITELTKLAKKK